jgi:TIR domain
MAVLVISYSRDDQPQVRALVSLLKAGLRDIDRAVYWDEQFEPGEPWFQQLRAHIDASPQLFVFWCYHSGISEQVKREFTYALAKKKRGRKARSALIHTVTTVRQ